MSPTNLNTLVRKQPVDWRCLRLRAEVIVARSARFGFMAVSHRAVRVCFGRVRRRGRALPVWRCARLHRGGTFCVDDGAANQLNIGQDRQPAGPTPGTLPFGWNVPRKSDLLSNRASPRAIRSRDPHAREFPFRFHPAAAHAPLRRAPFDEAVRVPRFNEDTKTSPFMTHTPNARPPSESILRSSRRQHLPKLLLPSFPGTLRRVLVSASQGARPALTVKTPPGHLRTD